MSKQERFDDAVEALDSAVVALVSTVVGNGVTSPSIEGRGNTIKGTIRYDGEHRAVHVTLIDAAMFRITICGNTTVHENAQVVSDVADAMTDVDIALATL